MTQGGDEQAPGEPSPGSVVVVVVTRNHAGSPDDDALAPGLTKVGSRASCRTAGRDTAKNPSLRFAEVLSKRRLVYLLAAGMWRGRGRRKGFVGSNPRDTLAGAELDQIRLAFPHEPPILVYLHALPPKSVPCQSPKCFRNRERGLMWRGLMKERVPPLPRKPCFAAIERFGSPARSRPRPAEGDARPSDAHRFSCRCGARCR